MNYIPKNHLKLDGIPAGLCLHNQQIILELLGKLRVEAALEEEEEPLHQNNMMGKAYSVEGVAAQLQEKY